MEDIKNKLSPTLIKMIAAIAGLGIVTGFYYLFVMNASWLPDFIEPSYLLYALIGALVTLVLLALKQLRASEPPVATIYIKGDKSKCWHKSSPVFIKSWTTSHKRSGSK